MNNGDSPATKHDLQQAVEQLRSEMSHGYNDLVERITDSETRVLKAMYGIAESFQKRVVQLEESDATLVHRLGIVEERLLQVEKRLNLPPSA
ncbi:MAG TPA: hypothetical protein VN841_14630 [Bryobacteraceae bacterium]|nr:hypothetical protein [Bryobacteraceae bacterium]